MLARTRRCLPAIASLLALAACKAETADQIEEHAAAPSAALGLMTSLPLFWPLGADFAAIANGTAEAPWQRGVLERDRELILLDTLSPIPGLEPGASESDPLAAIDHLAVIQPRGLSPADNVALDDWVRGGGALLLVLDPQLTGDYDLALGDPRRPADTALVAPVVTRWGLDIDFPPEAALDGRLYELPLGSGAIMAEKAGRIEIVNAGAADCDLFANNVVARCSIGEGIVTLVADAAVFEHQSLAGAQGETIENLLRFAFP